MLRGRRRIGPFVTAVHSERSSGSVKGQEWPVKVFYLYTLSPLVSRSGPSVQPGSPADGSGKVGFFEAAPGRMLWAFGTRRPGVQNRLVLAGVQVAPPPLRLVIIRLGLRPTLRASPIPHLLVLQVNVNLSCRQLQVHAFHIPRGFDPQNSSIQVPILHIGNCRTDPLKTRNSQESEEVGQEVRLLLHGTRHRRYKVYYSVQQRTRSAGTVRVFHGRHWARKDLTAARLRELMRDPTP